MHSSKFSSVTLVVSIMVDVTFYFILIYKIESSQDQTMHVIHLYHQVCTWVLPNLAFVIGLNMH